MADFNAHVITNIVAQCSTAFAKVAAAGQPDAQLFTMLARAAERCMPHFDTQELADTAWAFATAG